MGALWAVSFVSGSAVAADKGTITFNGTIVAGTCVVAVDSELAFADIDMNPLIDSDHKALVSKNFPITLSGCSGVVPGSKTPQITVTSVAAEGNKFKGGAGSTAVGPYFIINKYLRTDSEVLWSDSWAESDTLNSGDGMRPVTTTPPLFQNGTWYMTAAITCGTKAECNGADMRPGTLDTPLTLSFEWK
ncbi:TPA: type 1 fimbrial protein [Serratia marcescens]|nr:type 1 fimbrial protein [Serratia marcescens]